MLRTIIKKLIDHQRRQRGSVFFRYFNPTNQDKILDLGGADGSYMASLIPFRDNVYVAEIVESFLKVAREKYGFNSILLKEKSLNQYPAQSFDIVFSSSVIEHVTGPVEKIFTYKNWEDFKVAAWPQQQAFANQIRRLGKSYFVQTPNRYFWIESHTWLPLIGFLPRVFLLTLIPVLNKYWIKKTNPNFSLLSAREMQELFPKAIIVEEKFFFMTKSLMAIYKKS